MNRTCFVRVCTIVLILFFAMSCTTVENIRLLEKFGGPPYSPRRQAVNPIGSRFEKELAGAVNIGHFNVVGETGYKSANSAALRKGASLGADFVSIIQGGSRQLTPWSFSTPVSGSGPNGTTLYRTKLVERYATNYGCTLYRIAPTEAERLAVRREYFESHLRYYLRYYPKEFTVNDMRRFVDAGMGSTVDVVATYISSLTLDQYRFPEQLKLLRERLGQIVAETEPNIQEAVLGREKLMARIGSLKKTIRQLSKLGIFPEAEHEYSLFLEKFSALLGKRIPSPSRVATNDCFAIAITYDGLKNQREAMRWAEAAARRGQVDAQDLLGLLYQSPVGAGPNHAQAAVWFKKAAAQGHAGALNELGMMLETGRGVKADPMGAFRCYSQAAKVGSGVAMRNLARLYAEGTGVPKDLARSLEWYRKAAQQGDGNARFQVGRRYEEGIGVSPNAVKAFQWYTKAAESGNVPAQYRLGELYRTGTGVARDPAKAHDWLLRAAKEHDRNAQHALGMIYELGTGVPKNYESALQWYHAAAARGHQGAEKRLRMLREHAEQGDVELQYAHARACHQGIGTSPDPAGAARWYRLAAKQGHVDAQVRYGTMLLEGDGIPVDREAAYMWLEKAAATGDARAQLGMGRYWLTGDRRFRYEAKRWFRMAAEQGHAEAQYELGKYFFDGFQKGYNISLTETHDHLYWFGKAAAQGHLKALNHLGYLYSRGVQAPKDKQKGYSYYERAAKAGSAEAQYELGLMCKNRKRWRPGVDWKEVVKWYMMAAEQGHVGAAVTLGEMYYFGFGDHYERNYPPQDLGKARFWWLKAVQLGDPKAKQWLYKLDAVLRKHNTGSS